MLHNSYLDLFKTVMVVKTIISICNVYSNSSEIICKNLLQVYHHNKWFQPQLVFIIISDSLFTITHRVIVIRVQSHLPSMCTCKVDFDIILLQKGLNILYENIQWKISKHFIHDPFQNIVKIFYTLLHKAGF